MHAARSSETRDRILAAAEKLFAEQGVFAVSNRQVSEAAGQRNISAVGYHFGTKTDLVTAVFRRHSEEVESRREVQLNAIDDLTDTREWVGCLVFPYVQHLEALGPDSSYARFSAQVMTDPTLRLAVSTIALSSPSMRATLQGLRSCVAGLPVTVQRSRSEMASHLIVHMCAERERALSENCVDGATSWSTFAVDLVDAVVGLWCAQVSDRTAAPMLQNPQFRST
ncbi:TetR family transcriptional regulator [Rhodococcoides fascians A25f]|uniref:TetR/AcrR family transcriptional regulator n=1 Tax=Rhodococcoides fascians TaxID=1828 RepID=UPI0009B8B032|nr:TetR family transcriptional regulator [Rhodococcus fascians]QII09040.1 TetR family transcriptional regulator [Rhodococcus fascians A25f]